MEKQLSETSPKSFIKTNTIIHLALVAGVLIFLIVVFNLKSKDEKVFDPSNLFFIIHLGLTIGTIIIGHLITTMNLKRIQKSDSLESKLVNVQTANITKWALIEGPCLFGGVIFLNEMGNILSLGVSILGAAYLYSTKPTKAKIIEQGQLTYEEEKLI